MRANEFMRGGNWQTSEWCIAFPALLCRGINCGKSPMKFRTLNKLLKRGKLEGTRKQGECSEVDDEDVFNLKYDFVER